MAGGLDGALVFQEKRFGRVNFQGYDQEGSLGPLWILIWVRMDIWYVDF